MSIKLYTPNNLLFHRQQAELLQSDVANALGLVSTDRVSHWEKGTAIPSIINLIKLTVLYDVPTDALYPELFQIIQKEMNKLRPTYHHNLL